MAKQTFKGTINWGPKINNLTFNGAEIQKYTMKFSKDLETIESGTIENFPIPCYNKQGVIQKTQKFGIDLIYKQFKKDSSKHNDIRELLNPKRIDTSIKQKLSFSSPLYNMRKLKIKYSRRFRENICVIISKNFPNLELLQLNSCPLGLSDCSFLGKKYLPRLLELDLSGDCYLNQASLFSLSECMPQLRIFHLGHFEHSDYSCSKTVMKKTGQNPLKGLFIIELLYKKTKIDTQKSKVERTKAFAGLSTLYLEKHCDLTHFIK